MVKCLKIDRNSSSAIIRFNLDELGILVNSVGYMTDKHKVNLLSLSPDKEERERISEYVKMRKNLSKIMRSLV